MKGQEKPCFHSLPAQSFGEKTSEGRSTRNLQISPIESIY
jgi:hypothetical protein